MAPTTNPLPCGHRVWHGCDCAKKRAARLPSNMTKSQRKAIGLDPLRNPSNRAHKWSRVTEGSMQPDGNMDRITYTGSTGRIIGVSTHNRRGKAIG